MANRKNKPKHKRQIPTMPNSPTYMDETIREIIKQVKEGIQKQYHDVLIDAADLFELYPEKALSLLTQIERELPHFSKQDKAYFYHLRSRTYFILWELKKAMDDYKAEVSIDPNMKNENYYGGLILKLSLEPRWKI